MPGLLQRLCFKVHRDVLCSAMSPVLPSLLGKRMDACRAKTPSCSAEGQGVDYDGNVESLCNALSELCTWRPKVVVVKMGRTFARSNAPQHLAALRRLMHLLPFPVICHIESQATKGLRCLHAVDVLVALTCDLVECDSERLHVDESSTELLEMAMDHWDFFTASREEWSCKQVDWRRGTESLRSLSCYLPHFWMSLRNAGMAACETSTNGKLEGSFNFYFGPKIASLFAAADVNKSMGVGESKGRAVSIYRPEPAVLEVILTSDILYTSIEQLSCAVSDPAVQKIFVTLRDGELADRSSIFPSFQDKLHVLQKNNAP